MRILTTITAVILAASALPATAAHTNLVVNGGFETTTNGAAQFDSKTQATGWTSTGYNFIFAPGTADTSGTTGDYGFLALWGSNNGGNSAFTNSPTGGNFVGADGAFGVAPVQQTLTGLVAGHKYVVGFDWAGAQQYGYNGDTTEKWTVSLGNQSFSTATVNLPSHNFSGWMHQNFAFTATSGSEVLSFLATGTPSGEPPFSLLDGVSAAAVPEPATWALMLGGLGLVGGMLRTRRRDVVVA